MPDLGNTSVLSPTDASNASGTMPSWSGSALPSTIDDAGRALQGAIAREWSWRNPTVTSGGSANVQTLTYTVAPTAYYNGQVYSFLAGYTNTGATTLNVNALGAVSIKKIVAGSAVAIGPGDIAVGQIVTVSYNSSASAFLLSTSEKTGAIMPFAGSTAPDGWVLSYGQAISRTTYAALFAVLSTTYGTGDGSTTFNLPDLRGRAIAGTDDMGGTSADRLTGLTGGVNGDTLGGTGGEESHILSIAEMPSHDHNAYYGGTGGGAAGGGGVTSGARLTSPTGGGGAHNNVQPTIILNYIIKS